MSNTNRAAFEAWAKANRPRANIMYHMANGACLPGVDSWEYAVWQASRKAQTPDTYAVINTSGDVEYSAAWPEACHDHIKDMQEHNLDVCKWVVRGIKILENTK